MKQRKKSKTQTNTPASSDASRTRKPLYALDVGYGYTKVIGEDRPPMSFPSLVAPTDLQAIHVGLGKQSNTVTVDHVNYIVGEQALHRGFRFSEEYDGWWTSVRYRALIQYASQFIPPGSHVITGLPIHVFHTALAHQQVQDVIRRGLRASHVTLLPQGVGAFMAALQQDDRLNHSRVAVVDIGNRTTELVAFAAGDYLHHASKGIIHGIAPLYQQLAELIRPDGHQPLDPYEVEAAYRGIRPIRLNGKSIGQEEMKAQLESLIEPWLETLWSHMRSLWGDGAPSYDRILYCGGGAALLGSYLTQQFRNDATISENSQLANALGYLTYMQWQHEKEDALSPAPLAAEQRPDPVLAEPVQQA